MSQTGHYDWKKLLQFSSTVFHKAGVPAPYAEVVAQSLLHADLRGIESHGLARMPIYVERIEKGLIEPTHSGQVISDMGATILVDGQNQLGSVVGLQTLEQCLKRSRSTGIAIAGVRNSNHFGACSFYAEKAIEAGQILLIFTNAPETMAPLGGTAPFFGSNPLAIGIPTKQEPAYLLDMATTVVARGKIALAAKKGEQIPLGWAIDVNGQPTTDPAAALSGSILPVGGPKGYGLAMFIDVISGMLTGAGYGSSVYSLYDNWQHPQNIGHTFITIHIDHFLSRGLFLTAMDDYIRQIKASPKAEGVIEILIPGELEHRTRMKRMQTGIPLSTPVVSELIQLGNAYQVPFCEVFSVD